MLHNQSITTHYPSNCVTALPCYYIRNRQKFLTPLNTTSSCYHHQYQHIITCRTYHYRWGERVVNQECGILHLRPSWSHHDQLHTCWYPLLACPPPALAWNGPRRPLDCLLEADDTQEILFITLQCWSIYFFLDVVNGVILCIFNTLHAFTSYTFTWWKAKFKIIALPWVTKLHIVFIRSNTIKIILIILCYYDSSIKQYGTEQRTLSTIMFTTILKTSLSNQANNATKIWYLTKGKTWDP